MFKTKGKGNQESTHPLQVLMYFKYSTAVIKEIKYQGKVYIAILSKEREPTHFSNTCNSIQLTREQC